MLRLFDHCENNPDPSSVEDEVEDRAADPFLQDQPAAVDTAASAESSVPETLDVRPAGDTVLRDDAAAGPVLHADTEEPDTGLLQPFVRLAELYAPTDWGDCLRLATFQSDDIRLVPGQQTPWSLMLRNPITGMWRLQGNPDFTALFDQLLTEATEEAVGLAENDLTVDPHVTRRLQRHLENMSAGSVSRALKRSARLADEPCVRIPRVDLGSLNAVAQRPMLVCENGLVSLIDGALEGPNYKGPLHLVDTPACPTAFVPEARAREAPGAMMMRRFLSYLGCGDDQVLARRLGWQLCGHHSTIDVITGDTGTMHLLARVLRETLSNGAARLLSMDRGHVKTREAAHAMEQARLCLWPGADTDKGFPVWELNNLVADYDVRRQGNVVLLVGDWPENVESLDHRVAGRYTWALRVAGSLAEQDINPDILLDQDGRECLLAALVEGARRSCHEFLATKASTGVGDPSRVAASPYTLACAEELRLAGANATHRTLYLALQFTGGPDDVMTLADVSKAIAAAGEPEIPHHVIGQAIRRMWPAVESGRDRIDGVQTRVLRQVAPRTDHPGLDW